MAAAVPTVTSRSGHQSGRPGLRDRLVGLRHGEGHGADQIESDGAQNGARRSRPSGSAVRAAASPSPTAKARPAEAPSRPQINPCMTRESIDHNRNNPAASDEPGQRGPRRRRRQGQAEHRAEHRAGHRPGRRSPRQAARHPQAAPRHRPRTPKVNAPFLVAATVGSPDRGAMTLFPMRFCWTFSRG